LQPSRAAISSLGSPSAAASTIRQRRASAWALLGAWPSLQHLALLLYQNDLCKPGHRRLPPWLSLTTEFATTCLRTNGSGHKACAGSP
jgi:hypothetical protein